MRIGTSLTAIVLIATVAALLLPITYVRAETIVTHTYWNAVSRTPEYVGQSVTTPHGVGWNDILFSFLDDNDTTSVAYGTLFLLDQEYLGAPGNLNSTITGYLAESTGIISGGFGDKYSFASSVVLSPNTMYYFYANGEFPAFSFEGDTFNTYSGGTLYFGSTGTFVQYSNVDSNFLLEGNPVPEPNTMLLLGAGLVVLAGFGRKKFKK